MERNTKELVHLQQLASMAALHLELPFLEALCIGRGFVCISLTATFSTIIFDSVEFGLEYLSCLLYNTSCTNNGQRIETTNMFYLDVFFVVFRLFDGWI